MTRTEIHQSDNITDLQTYRESREHTSLINKTLAGLGIVAVAAVAGMKISERIGQPKSETVIEHVEPGDSLWGIVDKAEKDSGHNPNNIDIRGEVYRLTQKYGTDLHPGEAIKVEVK